MFFEGGRPSHADLGVSCGILLQTSQRYVVFFATAFCLAFVPGCCFFVVRYWRSLYSSMGLARRIEDSSGILVGKTGSS